MCLSPWGWVRQSQCGCYANSCTSNKRRKQTFNNHLLFEHSEEQLKLYCETCGELVCLQCIMKDGKHHDHEYVLLKKAFEKNIRRNYTSSLEPMEKQVATGRDRHTLWRSIQPVSGYCREHTHHLQATPGRPDGMSLAPWSPAFLSCSSPSNCSSPPSLGGSRWKPQTCSFLPCSSPSNCSSPPSLGGLRRG